jgi:mRNA-degrading endonuclease RelE of RelBE toxin-antitoxin system
VKQIEWSEESLDDLVALDKGIARRIKTAVERFAETGTGSLKKLQGIDPPEFRLRVGDFRVRFHSEGDTLRILRVRNRKEAYR